jgi:hypothetical protein
VSLLCLFLLAVLLSSFSFPYNSMAQAMFIIFIVVPGTVFAACITFAFARRLIASRDGDDASSDNSKRTSKARSKDHDEKERADGAASPGLAPQPEPQVTPSESGTSLAASESRRKRPKSLRENIELRKAKARGLAARGSDGAPIMLPNSSTAEELGPRFD